MENLHKLLTVAQVEQERLAARTEIGCPQAEILLEISRNCGEMRKLALVQSKEESSQSPQVAKAKAVKNWWRIFCHRRCREAIEFHRAKKISGPSYPDPYVQQPL